jgi:hypothetical protein
MGARVTAEDARAMLSLMVGSIVAVYTQIGCTFDVQQAVATLLCLTSDAPSGGAIQAADALAALDSGGCAAGGTSCVHAGIRGAREIGAAPSASGAY